MRKIVFAILGVLIITGGIILAQVVLPWLNRPRTPIVVQWDADTRDDDVVEIAIAVYDATHSLENPNFNLQLHKDNHPQLFPAKTGVEQNVSYVITDLLQNNNVTVPFFVSAAYIDASNNIGAFATIEVTQPLDFTVNTVDKLKISGN